MAGDERRRLQEMISSADEGSVDWVVEQERQRDGQSVSFKPVRVPRSPASTLFRYGQRVLMLSATILDADTYLSSLGIDPDEATVIRIDSSSSQ